MPGSKPNDLKILSDAVAVNLGAALGDELLLNRGQAAQFLSVSPRTVDAWCANIRQRRRRGRGASAGTVRVAIRPSRDRLPYIKLGHKVFFMLGDLRRFRDERKVAA